MELVAARNMHVVWASELAVFLAGNDPTKSRMLGTGSLVLGHRCNFSAAFFS